MRGDAYIPACWRNLGENRVPAPGAIPPAPTHSRVVFHGTLSLALVFWGTWTFCLTSPQCTEGLLKSFFLQMMFRSRRGRHCTLRVRAA